MFDSVTIKLKISTSVNTNFIIFLTCVEMIKTLSTLKTSVFASKISNKKKFPFQN